MERQGFSLTDETLMETLDNFSCLVSAIINSGNENLMSDLLNGLQGMAAVTERALAELRLLQGGNGDGTTH
jgi:hypothetical protein